MARERPGRRERIRQEATVQDPKSGPNKSKQAWDARALLEKHGFESVEEMDAALKALSVAKEVVVEAPHDLTAATPGIDMSRLPVPKDDLAWITRDTGAVHFVARYGTICIRPQQAALVPPLDAVLMLASGQGEWSACPFDLRSRTREQEILNMVHFGKWSYLALSAEEAAALYSDPRWPCPRRAVVSASEFRGWDRAAKQARGTYRDLPEVLPLREAVRRVLQRFVGEAFVDATYHPEMPDVRIANPYGNRLLGLVLKLPAVKVEGATA